MPDKRLISLVSLAVVFTGSILLVMFGLERHQSVALLSVYTLAFAAYLGVYALVDHKKKLWALLGLSVLLRLLILPAFPELSDDVYRFIWDGRLLVQGMHPFAYLPSEIMELGLDMQLVGIDQTLFSQLNSPKYYSIYPPVNQAIFALSAYLFSESVWGSILFIRLVIVIGELLTLFVIFSYLKMKGFADQKRLLLYALNPLIILELSGNLHFEALMICFLLISYVLLEKGRWILSTLFFALAICTKLLPLILLPLLLSRLGWRRAFLYYLLTAFFCLLFFMPLLSIELVQGISQSIGLYFQKFEFNASVYYIIREIGYELKGYNIIAKAGRWLAASTFLAIISYAIFERKKQLPTAWLWVWFIYLLLSTIVHPWYVTPMLAFAVFSHYRFAYVWSWLIFFSYAGYTKEGFDEVLSITILEYSIVIAVLTYELWKTYTRKSEVPIGH